MVGPPGPLGRALGSKGNSYKRNQNLRSFTPYVVTRYVANYGTGVVRKCVMCHLNRRNQHLLLLSFPLTPSRLAVLLWRNLCAAPILMELSPRTSSGLEAKVPGWLNVSSSGPGIAAGRAWGCLLPPDRPSRGLRGTAAGSRTGHTSWRGPARPCVATG